MRVALDIDDVLANFAPYFLDEMVRRGHITREERKTPSTDWEDARFRDNFHRITEDLSFWESIPPVFDPRDLKIEPIGYITARSVPTELTETWLMKHGFPNVRVITTGVDVSKREALEEMNPDIFVDDRYKNWQEAMDAGFLTLMVNKDHNMKYKNVPDYLRINCVTDLNEELWSTYM